MSLSVNKKQFKEKLSAEYVCEFWKWWIPETLKILNAAVFFSFIFL
jgi:hypothetical protein